LTWLLLSSDCRVLVSHLGGTNHPIESCQRAFHERYETKSLLSIPLVPKTRFSFFFIISPLFLWLMLLLNTVEQFEWPTAQRGRFVQRSGVQHNLSCIYHKNETGEENPKEKPQPSSATIR
jgi:hypothetical protein